MYLCMQLYYIDMQDAPSVLLVRMKRKLTFLCMSYFIEKNSCMTSLYSIYLCYVSTAVLVIGLYELLGNPTT